MEKMAIITKVIEPKEWVNSIVTTEKANGKVRICPDPRPLNTAILREHYPMKTVEEITATVSKAKYFSVLDASSGFWHVKLDYESSKLTTFNTSFGRYRFLRPPFGISSASEVFQRKMNLSFEDIAGTEVIVDDILVWGETIQEHNEHFSTKSKRH